jgi:cytoskeletal protein CcmA (bactofilin family)
MFSKQSKSNGNGTEPVVMPIPAKPQDLAPAPAKVEPLRTQAPVAAHNGTSVINADLTITGNLSCTANVQIDGKVHGDIDSKSLTIGEGAEVDGLVTTDSVVVCGNMQGKVHSNTVQLMGNAQVTGDIVHQSIAVEAGASIEGHLSRMKPE